MNIELTEIELTKRIMDVQDPDILERVRAVLPQDGEDFWNELTEDQKSETRLGIQQLNEGKGFDFDDFLRKHQDSERLQKEISKHLKND